MLTISKYDFGRITTGGKTYTSDILIHKESIQEWWRIEGHMVRVEDIEVVINDRPSVLIVGTGYYGAMKVSDDVVTICRRLGIELVMVRTREACRMYNDLVGEGKPNVSAALHLTC